MADTLSVVITDRDPDNELPIQPHQWGVRLEFPPVGNVAGASWSFDAPTELWAKIVKQAVDNMTEEQWLALKASPAQR